MGLTGAAALDGLRERFTDPTESPAFVERLGDLFAVQRIPAARAAVLAVLKTAPQRLQARWAAAMAGSPDGASELLSAVEGRQLPARLMAIPAVRTRVVAAQVADAAARIDRVVRTLPPADAARDALIATRRKAWEAGSSTSDLAVGERLFQQQCLVCHQINGRGGLVGPQLTVIGNRGAERLCEDVLDPNRNVDHAFRQTILTLKSGDTVSGLFRRDDGAQVILANAAGAEMAVARAEIVRREESELSLMPDNFSEVIPESEFRHLLAYLLAQKSAAR
jgi:putative heme-binding domain-containing protein